MRWSKLYIISSGVFGVVGPTMAQVSDLGITFGYARNQTGSSSSLVGYYASEALDTTNLSSVSQVSVLEPNSATNSLQPEPSYPYHWLFQTAYYSNLSGFDNVYGLGSYVFSGTSDTGAPLSATIANTVQMWTPAPSMVTNDRALQNYNINNSLTVNFTPFTQNTQASAASTIVEIIQTKSDLLMDFFEGPSSMNSFSIPAGLLAANQTYDFEIFDSNQRYFSDAAGFDNAQPFIFYDSVNDDRFTTLNILASPEPAPIVMMAVGLVGLLIRRSRAKCKTAEPT